MNIYKYINICIYEPGPQTPTPPPPMVWSPNGGGGPASYLLGFCMSDYQPCICWVFEAFLTTRPGTYINIYV